MIYVTGPFYGRYELFKQLLKKINFSDNDFLFILGNAIGYDPDSIKLLQELSYSPNIELLMGEQESFAKTLLPKFNSASDINEMIINLPDDEKAEVLEWVKKGGYEIIRCYSELNDDSKEGIMDYLGDLQGFSAVDAGGRSFLLASGIPEGFAPGGNLEEFEPTDCAKGNVNYSVKYFEKAFLITADISSDKIPGGAFGKVFAGKARHINVATLDPSQGRACALCLDTMKAQYGEWLEI